MDMQTETDIPADNRPILTSSSLAPVAGSDKSQILEPKSCSCLQRIVLFINELETGDNHADEILEHDEKDSGSESPPARRTLDSAVGLHKQALHYGQAMRTCTQCAHRSETRMLLLLLVNRLVALCSDMVSLYDPATQGGLATTSAAPLQQSIVLITVGDYEVDSDVERYALLRELIAVQCARYMTLSCPLQLYMNRRAVTSAR